MRQHLVTNGSLLGLVLGFVLGCTAPADGPTEVDTVSAETSVSVQPHGERELYAGRVDFDVEAGTFDADLTITTEPGDAAELTFLLAGSFENLLVDGSTVVAFEAQPMEPGAEWDTVTVRLDPERPAGPVDLRFRYSGRPALPDSRINAIGPDWVELSVDSAWHPIVLGQRFAVDIELGLPADWTVVAPGPVESIEGGFRLRSLGQQLDIVFTAAPGLDVADGDGARVFHRGADEATTTAVLEAAGTCREILDRRFGAERALPEVGFTLPDRDQSGYARETYIALTNVDIDDEVGLTRFLCHELAHYWSTGANWMSVDNWLNESFAVFVAAQAVREVFGPKAWEKARADWEARSTGQPTVWTPDELERRPYEVNYKKGPLAIARLEERADPEVFDRWVVRYMTEPIDDTPSLLLALEEEAGAETAAWFTGVLAE